MPLRRWYEQATGMPGTPGLRQLQAAAADWQAIALDLAAAGGRLVALWAARVPAGASEVRAAYLSPLGPLVATLPLPAGVDDYPGLHAVFPAAARMQRAVADLNGLRARDMDPRRWLRHRAWPEGWFPLGGTPTLAPAEPAPPDDGYPFTRVAGDGVHEIPVGPVHAGIIEPGHFRFSVVGEKVLKLEERLGYVHKGIERRFTELPLAQGHRLAARVSGDSAVAFSWAYCQALEGLAGATVPARAAWLRAAGLEIERLANHLGDLGALGNDAGFAFGLAQFSRLKELLLRRTEEILGRRYLMDFAVPGGVDTDLSRAGAATLVEFVDRLSDEVRRLRGIYDEHAGVRERFAGTGTVPPELAARLGLAGLAGRASGQDGDLRRDLPCAPYDVLQPAVCSATGGDVAARVAVRFDEVEESCRLLAEIGTGLPAGPVRCELPEPAAGGTAIGLVEGWRGPVLVALTAAAGGGIARCHPHDPSWHNWPALEHAVLGNMVPDFPLINKSFNLSYSGHDL